jgi:hypothetical protein
MLLSITRTEDPRGLRLEGELDLTGDSSRLRRSSPRRLERGMIDQVDADRVGAVFERIRVGLADDELPLR